MKNFSIEYHNHTIQIEVMDNYRLTFPDGRWLITNFQEDYSKVVASSDADSRQRTPSQWVIVSSSGGPDWVNREQLQVIGELINRKKHEFESDKIHS